MLGLLKPFNIPSSSWIQALLIFEKAIFLTDGLSMKLRLLNDYRHLLLPSKNFHLRL